MEGLIWEVFQRVGPKWGNFTGDGIHKEDLKPRKWGRTDDPDLHPSQACYGTKDLQKGMCFTKLMVLGIVQRRGGGEFTHTKRGR